MKSVTLLNKMILVMCTYENKKEKKERLKVCAKKIKRSIKQKDEDTNKRKSNEIAKMSDEEEEVERAEQMETEEGINNKIKQPTWKGMEEYLKKHNEMKREQKKKGKYGRR